MRRFTVALLLALGLTSGVAFAQSYSTVEERMTGAEFKSAGLDKLSPEELAALNAWLQKQSGRVLAADTGYAQMAQPAEDRNGFDESGNRRKVNSRLIGDFTGWTGHNEFTLENGQVWAQTDGASLVGVKTLRNPQVSIKPGLMGVWRLKVAGYNSSTKVKRIK